MSAVVENAVSTRSSSGEYTSNPLSPPSFGLDPPNMSSPIMKEEELDSESDDSRDSSRFTRDRLSSVTSVGDIEFSPSPKPMTVMSNSDAASTSVQRGTSPSQRESRKRIGSIANAGCSGEKRTATKICRVCGDKAYSYNFNVITCESCKAFFRRNANKDKEIRCPFNDQCDINIVSRRFCQRCRLQKCFNVGMKKEWIMSEEARIEKKQRVQENRERRLAEANNLINQQKKVAKQLEGDDASSSKAFLRQPKEEPIPLVPQDSSLNAPTSNNTIYNVPLPSLSGGTTPVSLPGGGTLCDVAAPGSVDSLPSPMITTAGFRPPLITDSIPTSTLIAPTNAAIVQQPQNAFISPQQQQGFVNQVAQQMHFAQAQIQQAAQLEQHLQQQAAVQLVQQQATAHHIVQHQAAQLAVVQAQQQRLAAAAVAVAAAVPAGIPSIPSAPTPVSIASLNSPSQLAPLSIITQNVPPPTIPQNVHMVSDASLTATHSDADMVTIPKKVLLKLVEQNNQKSGGNSSSLPPNHSRMGVPQKCVCTCLCGRYQPGKLVVDEVMTELLANSTSNSESIDSKSQIFKLSQRKADDWSSTISTSCDPPNPEEVEKKSPRRSLFKDASLLDEEISCIKVDPDCCMMTSSDQDRLNELIGANVVWAELDPNSVDAARHEHGCPSKVEMVNMADGAIRRMIKMLKRIETFRRIEHHDQIQLLKNSCMEYIILRGAMSYDPEQNAWKGPTINSGYNVKMDAMKDTQDNMFESSIRFYSTFKEEWRTNESVMLLLGMVVVFNPDFPGLHNRVVIERENHSYRRVLKRLLYSLCDQDAKRTNIELKGLLDKITYLKLLNVRAQRMLHEVDSSQMEPLLLEMFSS